MRSGNVRWLHRQVRGPASTLVLLALVVLGSFWPAAAQERAPAITTAGSMGSTGNTEAVSYLYLPLVLRAHDPDVLIDEGFEAGAVPPAGWTLIQANPSFTWELWPFTPPWSGYPLAYQGSFSAAVVPDWESDQDEVLLSPSFEASAIRLDLHSFGSPMLCRDFFDWCDLKIWVVVGDWDAGAVDDVYVGKADPDWSGELAWSPSSWDLALPVGTPVRIALEYDGLDGEVIGLDSIRVTRQ